MEGKKTRPATVEGLFYPADKDELLSRTQELLDRASTPPGRASAIITPHAAFDYSGHIAAEAFKAAAQRTIKTAVLLGPVHRDLSDAIILPESTKFHTPLGDIAVDQLFPPTDARINAAITKTGLIGQVQLEQRRCPERCALARAKPD